MAKIYNYVDALNIAHTTLAEKKVSPTARYLYLCVLHIANASYWRSEEISIPAAEKATGLSRATLFRCKHELVEKGFLLEKKKLSINFNLLEYADDERRKENRAGISPRHFAYENIKELENI